MKRLWWIPFTTRRLAELLVILLLLIVMGAMWMPAKVGADSQGRQGGRWGQDNRVPRPRPGN